MNKINRYNLLGVMVIVQMDCLSGMIVELHGQSLRMLI